MAVSGERSATVTDALISELENQDTIALGHQVSGNPNQTLEKCDLVHKLKFIIMKACIFPPSHDVVIHSEIKSFSLADIRKQDSFLRNPVDNENQMTREPGKITLMDQVMLLHLLKQEIGYKCYYNSSF